MTDGYLKLTAYFGERLRGRDRFLADELLELYGTNQVATSVVLRGIAGFGPHHVLRSDRSLSMSEDPPIAVAAVDVAPKIAALADRVATATTRGLITVERARMLDGSTELSTDSDTVKLTVYVGRHLRVGGRPAYRAVCDVLHRNGFDGASVFLGVDGTSHGQRRRARFFSRNNDVPLMIVAVGGRDRVTEALPTLRGLLPRQLLTVERAQVCKRDGRLLARPTAPRAVGDAAVWQKLMVYTSEGTLHDGMPVHRAIVRRLFERRAAGGATVLRGVWGFHGDHPPDGDRLIQLSRRVPVTTVVVDTPERIAASFDVIDELTVEHGLVTCERVPALVSVDDGERRGSTRLARFDQ